MITTEMTPDTALPRARRLMAFCAAILAAWSGLLAADVAAQDTLRRSPVGRLVARGETLPVHDVMWTVGQRDDGALAVEPLFIEVPMAGLGLEVRRWLREADTATRTVELEIEAPTITRQAVAAAMVLEGAEPEDVAAAPARAVAGGTTMRLELRDVQVSRVCSVLSRDGVTAAARERWELIPAAVTWTFGEGMPSVVLDFTGGTAASQGTSDTAHLTFGSSPAGSPTTQVWSLESGVVTGPEVEAMTVEMVAGRDVVAIVNAAWSGAPLGEVTLAVSGGVEHRFGDVQVQGFSLRRAPEGPLLIGATLAPAWAAWSGAGGGRVEVGTP